MLQKYPKFRDKEDCAFPERDNCNYDEFDKDKPRCPYMKYDNSKSIFDSTRWHCIFDKNQLKSEHNQEKIKSKEDTDVRQLDKRRTNKTSV